MILHRKCKSDLLEISIGLFAQQTTLLTGQL